MYEIAESKHMTPDPGMMTAWLYLVKSAFSSLINVFLTHADMRSEKENQGIEHMIFNRKGQTVMRKKKRIFGICSCIVIMALLLGCATTSSNMAISSMQQDLVLEPEAKDARSAQDKIYEWELMLQENQKLK